MTITNFSSLMSVVEASRSESDSLEKVSVRSLVFVRGGLNPSQILRSQSSPLTRWRTFSSPCMKFRRLPEVRAKSEYMKIRIRYINLCDFSCAIRVKSSNIWWKVNLNAKKTTFPSERPFHATAKLIGQFFEMKKKMNQNPTIWFPQSFPKQ